MKRLTILLFVFLLIMPCSTKEDEPVTMGGEEIEISNPDNGGE